MDNGSRNRSEGTNGGDTEGYRSLGRKERDGTNFFAIVGPQSVLCRDTGVHPSEIPDGSENIVVVIEAFNTGIKWFEPSDISIDLS